MTPPTKPGLVGGSPMSIFSKLMIGFAQNSLGEDFIEFVVQKNIFGPIRIFYARRIFYEMRLFCEKCCFLAKFGGCQAYFYILSNIFVVKSPICKKTFFGKTLLNSYFRKIFLDPPEYSTPIEYSAKPHFLVKKCCFWPYF